MTNCDLCGSPLVIELESGRRVSFSMHSDEYCKELTRARLRILDAMVKQHVLAESALRHECTAQARRLADLEDRIGDTAYAAGVIATKVINGEKATADDLTKLYHLIGAIADPPTRPARTSEELRRAEDASRRDLANARRELALRSGEIGTPPQPEFRPDLHHSQGVHVAEVLAGIESPPATPGPGRRDPSDKSSG